MNFRYELNGKVKVFHNRTFIKKLKDVMVFMKKNRKASMKELFRKINGRCEHIVAAIRKCEATSVVEKKIIRNGTRGRPRIIYVFNPKRTDLVSFIKRGYIKFKKEINKYGYKVIIEKELREPNKGLFSLDKFHKHFPSPFENKIYYLIQGRGKPKKLNFS